MSQPESLPPNAVLMQLIAGKWVSMAISVAAKLRLADELVSGPHSIEDLARRTKTHEASLFRLMRALAGVGVFVELSPRVFGQTPLSELLRTGVPGSLRGVADYCGAEWSWLPWGRLIDSVRTGETVFNTVFGQGVFEYFKTHPEESEVFNEGMTGFSTQSAGAVAQAYDFSQFGTLADVGGGHGALLTTILQAHPRVRGIVYDIPHVVAGARETIHRAGLEDRCKAEGGDFFQGVPPADAYIMRHIIHDWHDDDALKILRRCREAIWPKGKLLLVELVIPPGNDPHPGKLLDLEMLCIASGKERTEEEYRELYARAGWKLTRVVPTQSPVSIIEGEPV